MQIKKRYYGVEHARLARQKHLLRKRINFHQETDIESSADEQEDSDIRYRISISQNNPVDVRGLSKHRSGESAFTVSAETSLQNILFIHSIIIAIHTKAATC